ncbi:hypothetical protein KBC99_00925 [Candidatus Saccharibacteria bacterium]|nr:hypothetical protein [Candidatus Saccharibacteria bacterium]
MSERFEEKAKDLYSEHRKSAGYKDLSKELKESGDAGREVIEKRRELRREDMATLDVSDELQNMVASGDQELGEELARTEKIDTERVEEAEAGYDDILKKAKRHYKWHKGAYRESALKDAASEGYDINTPDALPPESIDKQDAA